MGFYGNTTDTSKTHFQFDKIFSSRTEMDRACAEGTDEVYTGRFVLVKYDQGAYYPGHILYGYINPGEPDIIYVDALCTKPYMFVTYIPVVNPRQEDWESYYELSADERFYIKLTSQNQFNANKTYYTHSLKNVDNSLRDDVVSENTIVFKKDITTKVTDGKFYKCIGEDDLHTGRAKWELINISEDDSIGSYLLNFHLDFTTYGDLFDYRGYDATVWEKTYNEGKGKFIYIANLNAHIPSFEIYGDPPSELPTIAYIDSTSSNDVYRIKVPNFWGFQIKEAEENSPSDQIISQKYYKYDINNKIEADVKENVRADIYFNLNKEEDGQIFSHKNYKLRDDNTKDEIIIAPTGKSGKKYYNTNGEFVEQEDTQELSIHLPIVGNMISDGYDLIYGENEQDEETGKITRPRDIKWYEGDSSEELKYNGEQLLGGKTHNLSTLAGTLNTMHDRLGQNIKTYKTKPSQEQAALLSEDYIYYISDLDTYYRVGKKLSYENIPNNNISFKNISLTEQEFVTQTYYVHTVAINAIDSVSVNVNQSNINEITKNNTTGTYTVITTNESTHYFTVATSYDSNAQYAVKDISIEQYSKADLTYYEPNKYFYIIGSDYYKDTNPDVPLNRDYVYCTINEEDLQEYIFSNAYEANTYFRKNDNDNYICAEEEIPDINTIYYSPLFVPMSSSSTDLITLYQPNKYYILDNNNQYVLDTSPALAQNDSVSGIKHFIIEFDYENPSVAQNLDGTISLVYRVKSGPTRVYLTATEANTDYYLKVEDDYIHIKNLTDLSISSANFYKKTSTNEQEAINADKLFIPNKFYKLLRNGLQYHLASSVDFTNDDKNSTIYYSIAQVHSLPAPFYEAAKYYYYNGEFYHLDMDDPPTAASFDAENNEYVHYNKKSIYVKSDTSKRCPEGMEWNSFSLYVPASVELGLLVETKDLIPMNGLVDNKISMNGAVLAFDKIYNADDNKTRDINTLKGTLNTTADFFYSVKNLIPNRILYVNDFGQITSSEEGLTYQDILALKNLIH